MSNPGTIGLFSEVNAKVLVELHSAIIMVNVDLNQHCPLTEIAKFNDCCLDDAKKVCYLRAKLRIELLVPRRKQGRCNVEPLAIQTQLEHLRSTTDSLSFNIGWIGLLLKKSIS